MDESGVTTITSVVAHIDHGKTSLMDSLIASQGRISKALAGSLRFLDTREDEQSRGITLKLSATTLEHCGRRHVFIDTPGHVDFESLIQTSSLFSDSFLVLIDINEGITPRTYSLVNYVRNKECTLVINKIDKVGSETELLQKIGSIVSSVNALVGEEMFVWEKNNIILCCATLCYGINSNVLRKTVGRDGTMRNAVGFLFHLYGRIERNEVERICASFNILVRNRKSILSTVLPLANCIFDSVVGRSTAPHAREVDMERLFRSELVNLRPMGCGREPSLVGVTAYGILRTAGDYCRDALVFVTRIFRGILRVGDTVYSVDDHNVTKCTVNNIYTFGINELVEVSSVRGPDLVCIGGNFLKNSLITDIPSHWIDIESKVTPFYRSKLVLNNMDQLDELKRVFRVMSCTEQLLRVKLNKYREMEVLCAGRVQFEKITTDLTELGFDYSVADFEPLFCEYATEMFRGDFSLEGLGLRIEVGQREERREHREAGDPGIKGWEDSHGNQFVLVSGQCCETAESVLEVFVSSGPLIRENVHNTRFVLDVEGETGHVPPDAMYSFLRTSLTTAYSGSSPSIAPLFYECSISIQEEFIGEIYKSLSKYNYVARGEDYEEKTGFHVILALVPQFLYADFLEDVRIKTKGTGYLLLKEAGYVCAPGFDKYIHEVRKRKGLFVEEKIADAAKQRARRQ